MTCVGGEPTVSRGSLWTLSTVMEPPQLPCKVGAWVRESDMPGVHGSMRLAHLGIFSVNILTRMFDKPCVRSSMWSPSKNVCGVSRRGRGPGAGR